MMWIDLLVGCSGLLCIWGSGVLVGAYLERRRQLDMNTQQARNDRAWERWR